MMDKLLHILKTDPNYQNFTFDGQIIPIEDYLEVRPNAEEDIKRFVKEQRLSIGPMYVLPDEFLISGESLIRNFMFGIAKAREFGRAMKVAYIPDPFGHIAQSPQIVSGFDLSSIIFERGFGDEFEEYELNMEFIWKAPGNAASVLGIHLIRGYGSLAQLFVTKENGKYTNALKKIQRLVSDLEHYTATPIVLLNNGSDHFEAYSEIPEIINQWNEMHPEVVMEQNDFEYYISKILELKPKLKNYQGELRGAKYSHLLSGVFSARMWIKQRNTEIEYFYEKYAEPLSSITWALDKFHDFKYPRSYLDLGLKWLIKNHPHDSICGCSIDEVHREMITRFDWSEQIAYQICKLSWLYLLKILKIKKDTENTIHFFIYNPLPWRRRDIVRFNYLYLSYIKSDKDFQAFRILDDNENDIEYELLKTEENPRYISENQKNYEISFIADIPACGFRQYHFLLIEDPLKQEKTNTDQDKTIENEFFKVAAKENGRINIFDKENLKLYEDICSFEDVGDWGDEYDFSGPYRKQVDKKFETINSSIIEIKKLKTTSIIRSLIIKMKMMLPSSLSEDRLKREDNLVENYIELTISLYKNIRRIDFSIEMTNNSKDHRIRVLFPSKINTKQVFADGHFYIVPRNIELPEGKRWMQKPSPTNHQKDFIAIYGESISFAVANRGLPEYEAIKNDDGTITLAITLLRCVGWLSREKMDARANNAGPALQTPNAQCLGKHKFELSLFIENYKHDWFKAEIPAKAKEFNCPLFPIIPSALKSILGSIDKLMIIPLGNIDPFSQREENSCMPYLPENLSFLEIDNKNIMLSILKKAEVGEFLIVRLYNITSKKQKLQLKFTQFITIKNARIVNLMEEIPKNPIKATIDSINKNSINLSIDSNVIFTIKIEL